jgi:hypothetical protein
MDLEEIWATKKPFLHCFRDMEALKPALPLLLNLFLSLSCPFHFLSSVGKIR